MKLSRLSRVCVVFVAVLALSTVPSRSATPASGALSDTALQLSYSSGPFNVTNVSGQVGAPVPLTCNAASPCDDYALKVILPKGYLAINPQAKITISTAWSGTAEDDLYLIDSAGNQIASAVGSSSPNTLTFYPVEGSTSYTVRIVPSLATGNTADTIIKLVPTPPAGTVAGSSAGYVAAGTPAAAAAGIAPRFQHYIPTEDNGAPSAGMGLVAAEPTMGVNTKTGQLFYQALFEVLRITFDDSTSPAHAKWEHKDPPTGVSDKASLDPIFLADPTTQRLWATQLSGGQALTDISDDNGETWTPGLSGGIGSGADHQGMGVGVYPTSGPGSLIQHPLYPNALYYCSQQIAASFCSRSDDGGKTYGPIVPIYDAATSKCVGLHGHPKVAPDGTVYVPNKGCGLDTPVIGSGLQNVVVSEDAGVTWTIRSIPDSTGSLLSKGDPSVGIDSTGKIYVAYQDLNTNHMRVATSKDKGVTFSPSVDIGALTGITYAVFPAVAAGDPGRAGVAFFGTTYGKSGDYQDMSFPGIWYLYISTTYDGGKTWFTQNVTPDNPIQGFGGIGNSADNRNHYDFIDAQIGTDGRFIASNSIGCSAACPQHNGTNTFSRLVGVARQSGGRRMYAKFDPIEPSKPAGPFVSGYRSPTKVVLSWPEPDGGGSAVTGYNVYRTIGSGAEVLIASITTQRQYTDVTDATSAYSYRVTALNALGEGASSNIFAPAVGFNQPHPELACKIPGQLWADRTGEGGTVPLTDITTFGVSEPTDMPNKLVFTINNTQPGLVQAGNSVFYIYFDPPNGRIRYRLLYSANPAGAFNEIDTGKDNDFTNDPTPELGGEKRTWTSLGALEAGSGIQSDGSVRLIVDKTKLNFNSGDTIYGIAAREDAANQPPDGSILLTDYAGGRQDYTLVGNDFCTKSATGGGTGGGGSGTGNSPVSSSPGTSTATDTGQVRGRFGGGAFGVGFLLPLAAIVRWRRQRRRWEGRRVRAVEQ
jgi:hypothetical protein